ncbi:hypothetical protein [Spongorhabdus nitratireducens]
MMKVLNIIETAYRATLEEQDDTILWLSQAMANAGANIDVLLQGNAVSYGVRSQDASGLNIGHFKQTQPPEIAADLQRMMDKDINVYIVQEDLTDRGIEPTELMDGLHLVHREQLAGTLDKYQQVWHW